MNYLFLKIYQSFSLFCVHFQVLSTKRGGVYYQVLTLEATLVVFKPGNTRQRVSV